MRNIEHLMRLISQKTDACILWDRGRRSDLGYGSVYYGGRNHRANRLACELAHGAPPSRGLHKYHAAHSCGNDACVNPKHLRWATPKENRADMFTHGTRNIGERHGRSRLKRAHVKQIVKLLGKETHQQIGLRFGVARSTISSIARGHSWGWLTQNSRGEGAS